MVHETRRRRPSRPRKPSRWGSSPSCRSRSWSRRRTCRCRKCSSQKAPSGRRFVFASSLFSSPAKPLVRRGVFQFAIARTVARETKGGGPVQALLVSLSREYRQANPGWTSYSTERYRGSAITAMRFRGVKCAFQCCAHHARQDLSGGPTQKVIREFPGARVKQEALPLPTQRTNDEEKKRPDSGFCLSRGSARGTIRFAAKNLGLSVRPRFCNCSATFQRRSGGDADPFR